MFSSVLESFKGMVRSLVQAWNKLDISFTVPDIWGVPNRGETIDLIPDFPVPFMAEGGIVSKPTLAVIGEGSEPEAVVPLSKLGAMGGGGGTVNVTVNMPAGSSGEDVVAALQSYVRRRGALPLAIGSARF